MRNYHRINANRRITASSSISSATVGDIFPLLCMGRGSCINVFKYGKGGCGYSINKSRWQSLPQEALSMPVKALEVNKYDSDHIDILLYPSDWRRFCDLIYQSNDDYYEYGEGAY